VTSARRYVLHVVASTAAPEQVQGTLSFVSPPPVRHGLDAAADVRYSPNVTVLAPGAARDCEPSLRVDVRGNAYVGGIRGVPAGVDLWRFDLDPASATYDPQLRSPVYLGQPDAFAPEDTVGGRDGGGDIDIATAFPGSAALPAVTIVSLAAANISSAVSSDKGEHFTLSPAVANVPADDRQWIEAHGDAIVYQMYRAPIPATGLWVQKSLDHGVSWGTASLVSPTGTSPGYIDVDHGDGTVYVSHTSSSALFVSRSSDGGTTWSTATVDNSSTHGSLFDPVKVGDDGTVYVAWSDEHNVYMAHSTDHGAHWSPPVKVNGPESVVALFPWLEAGSAGRVAVVWFGTSQAANDDGADWRVRSAITLDATATDPHFHRAEVSDHVVHSSNISLGGLGVDTPVTPQPNRNLCDYFQVAIDPLGACVVAFTDDHNDFDGHTYLARQLAGPSLYAAANGGTGVLVPFGPAAAADARSVRTGARGLPPRRHRLEPGAHPERQPVRRALGGLPLRGAGCGAAARGALPRERPLGDAGEHVLAGVSHRERAQRASTNAARCSTSRPRPTPRPRRPTASAAWARAHNGSYTLTPLGAATGGQISASTDEGGRAPGPRDVEPVRDRRRGGSRQPPRGAQGQHRHDGRKCRARHRPRRRHDRRVRGAPGRRARRGGVTRAGPSAPEPGERPRGAGRDAGAERLGRALRVRRQRPARAHGARRRAAGGHDATGMGWPERRRAARARRRLLDARAGRRRVAAPAHDPRALILGVAAMGSPPSPAVAARRVRTTRRVPFGGRPGPHHS
jgi:hypothetical protein